MNTPKRPQLTIEHAQAEVNGCNHIITRTTWFVDYSKIPADAPPQVGKFVATCNCGREQAKPTEKEVKAELEKLNYWLECAEDTGSAPQFFKDRARQLRSMITPKRIGKARHCSGWIESQGKTAKNGARSVYWFYRWEIWTADGKLTRTPARAIDPDRIGELRLMIHDKLPVAEILDRATEWQR